MQEPDHLWICHISGCVMKRSGDFGAGNDGEGEEWEVLRAEALTGQWGRRGTRPSASLPIYCTSICSQVVVVDELLKLIIIKQLLITRYFIHSLQACVWCLVSSVGDERRKRRRRFLKKRHRFRILQCFLKSKVFKCKKPSLLMSRKKSEHQRNCL